MVLNDKRALLFFFISLSDLFIAVLPKRENKSLANVKRRHLFEIARIDDSLGVFVRPNLYVSSFN